MMQSQPSVKSFIVVLTCSSLFAAILTLVKLPDWLFYFRPDWIALVAIYWVLMTPDRVALGYGCLNGILLDLILVKPFGLHAIPFVILSYLVASWSSQIRVLSLWQQCLFIAVLILAMKALVGMIASFTTDFVFTGYYWLSTLGNLLFWPVITIVFRDLRQLFHRSDMKG